MAKPHACPKCGHWYNPRFQGTDEMCGSCWVKEKMQPSNLEENVDKQKVKTETSEPASAKPRTTRRPAPTKIEKEDSDYQGTCKKCGLLVEGQEVYDSERGWTITWAHIVSDRNSKTYCLTA